MLPLADWPAICRRQFPRAAAVLQALQDVMSAGLLRPGVTCPGNHEGKHRGTSAHKVVAALPLAGPCKVSQGCKQAVCRLRVYFLCECGQHARDPKACEETIEAMLPTSSRRCTDWEVNVEPTHALDGLTVAANIDWFGICGDGFNHTYMCTSKFEYISQLREQFPDSGSH